MRFRFKRTYTAFDGFPNPAALLPDDSNRPDLGPRIYKARSTPFQVVKATTRLHVDVSDALHVLVPVELPTKTEREGN